MKFWIRLFAYLFVAACFSTARADDHVDFFRAVAVDNALTVRELLERGFDPNTRSEKGQTALYLAMREGSPRVAAALIAHRHTRIDAANEAGETAVMMAALRGNLEWTAKLLDLGAALERPGWAPLHYAATGPEPMVVTLLLDRGAQVDARSPNGSTPLMMAARYGAEGSVDLLLARGADPRRRNDIGLAPVDFAKQSGRDWLAERLQRLDR